MTADEIPYAAVADISELGPAPFHPYRYAFREGVIQTAHELEAEDCIGNPGIPKAERAGSRLFGLPMIPGRIESNLQIFAFRLAHEAVGVAHTGPRPPKAATQVRRPARVVQHVVIRVHEELVRDKVRYPLRGRGVPVPFAVFASQRLVSARDLNPGGIASMRPVHVLEFDAKPVQRVPQAQAAQKPRIQIIRVVG